MKRLLPPLLHQRMTAKVSKNVDGIYTSPRGGLSIRAIYTDTNSTRKWKMLRLSQRFSFVDAGCCLFWFGSFGWFDP
jgi:hypothetical protein